MNSSLLQKRFWDRVDMSGGEDACWPWTGSNCGRKRYGILYISGKPVRAHRLALQLSKEPPPPQRPCACHHCDNPPCCNPKHLWWGSNKENIQDSVKKGRHALGHRTIDRDVAVRLRSEGWSYGQLAAHFSVNPASLGKILTPLGLGGQVRPNQYPTKIGERGQ